MLGNSQSIMIRRVDSLYEPQEKFSTMYLRYLFCMQNLIKLITRLEEERKQAVLDLQLKMKRRKQKLLVRNFALDWRKEVSSIQAISTKHTVDLTTLEIREVSHFRHGLLKCREWSAISWEIHSKLTKHENRFQLLRNLNRAKFIIPIFLTTKLHFSLLYAG